MALHRTAANKLPVRNAKPPAKPRAEVAPAMSERERPTTPLVRAAGGAALVRPDYREFARKLREAMAASQMSASDVARAIWGSVSDPRGYQVAKNRDRIGAYLAGTGYPSKETLPKLCAAVGLSMDELPVPQRSTAARTMSPSPADLSFNLLQDHPGLCSFYIRTVMSVETGLKIIALVKQDREGGMAPEEKEMATPSAALDYNLEQMIDALIQKRMTSTLEERQTIVTREATGAPPLVTEVRPKASSDTVRT